MRLFVIRPFGKKEDIDFDAVHAELIQPAVDQLAKSGFVFSGGTTGEISKQGNIREDMFRLIVASDLVIADVSVDNANVFYELGIRHALRPRHTLLIRAKSNSGPKFPFDLQTDRYFLYDAANPSQNVAALAIALRDTISTVDVDSPVFALLPKLVPHGRGQLVLVPREFEDEVKLALVSYDRGKLRLLAHEVSTFAWDQEGLQLVGDAQFKLRAFPGARETFEALRSASPDNILANLRLGTIYQRLTMSEPAERKEELLTRSDQAIRRVLATPCSANDKVEAYCLLGSNAKTRWIADFADAASQARLVAALRSPHFKAMLDCYLTASSLGLNAHYPLVNALGLLKLQIGLANQLPDIWQADFDDDEKARVNLAARETLATRLSSSLCLALNMDEIMGSLSRIEDPWAVSSRADYLLLTSTNRTERVVGAYRESLSGADRFTLEAVRRNLATYRDLGQFEPSVSAAIQVVNEAIALSKMDHPAPTRVILFTGHMVDAADRPKENTRFPRTVAAEQKARELIESAVRSEQIGHEGRILGIAGGACGGDILFHEVCEQLGIQSELYLALPEDKFQVTSVARGGAYWVDRYQRLIATHAPHVLQTTEAPPRWLASKTSYDIWQRNNLWMMFSAVATGSRNLSLVGLHNTELEPDGPGGARHLIDEARKWGFKSIQLDARKLLQDKR